MINKVLVNRFDKEEDWTISRFYFDQTLKGYGMEDEIRAIKKKGETCIDGGIYELGLRLSPKFSHEYYRDGFGNLIQAKERKTPILMKTFPFEHELVWVMNVPKFEYVLWHWGNTDDETDACYLVGGTIGTIGNQAAVLGSRMKYMEIYPELWRAIQEHKKNGTKLYVEYK